MRCLVAVLLLLSAVPAQAQPMAEWSFLVFINGHNNLDPWGADTINQMERVGSTPDLNLVVQWASLTHGKTRRLLVQKDADAAHVTSPILEELGVVDMGDWRSLVDFVRWAHEHYPARHYFINVWNHGTGWHSLRDVSYDDIAQHGISTLELGQAIEESARLIGHKIDVYGSDACLMGMAEVASQLADHAEVFIGSEQVEPSAGWPYYELVSRWALQPQMSGDAIARILTREFVKYYQEGAHAPDEVTLSAFDLSRMRELEDAVGALGRELLKLDAAGRQKFVMAAWYALDFSYADYGDLLDFIAQLEEAAIEQINPAVLQQVRKAAVRLVIANHTTSKYAHAGGIAFWLPYSLTDFRKEADKYRELRFEARTHWADALEFALQEAGLY